MVQKRYIKVKALRHPTEHYAIFESQKRQSMLFCDSIIAKYWVGRLIKPSDRLFLAGIYLSIEVLYSTRSLSGKGPDKYLDNGEKKSSTLYIKSMVLDFE